MLHGYNGANPVYVKWWSIDLRHNDVVDKYPIIYIEPHGRGNTSYLGIGDQDILKCIELAKQKFNVDNDRVYLKGESMGVVGHGTLAQDIPNCLPRLPRFMAGGIIMLEQVRRELQNSQAVLFLILRPAVLFRMQMHY